MKVSGLILVGFVAAAQAGFVKNIAKKIFSRDEIEQLMEIAARSTNDIYVGKIKNWNKPFPVGISPGLQTLLKSKGCNPPAAGSKVARRALESEVTIEDIINARHEKRVQQSEAWAAAENPGAFPPEIKAAFKGAGWSGTCVGGGSAPGGKKARSLDDELFELELAAREFDDGELAARDYDDDFFWSE